MGKRSRFGDRSYREHCRRELRFPTTFKTHQLTLDEALVFSDDSRLLASGSKDGKIRIWDIENLFAHVNLGRTGLKPNMNREASFLGRHEDGVRALSFHRIAESLLVDVRMVQSNCGMCPLIFYFLPL